MPGLHWAAKGWDGIENLAHHQGDGLKIDRVPRCSRVHVDPWQPNPELPNESQGLFVTISILTLRERTQLSGSSLQQWRGLRPNEGITSLPKVKKKKKKNMSYIPEQLECFLINGRSPMDVWRPLRTEQQQYKQLNNIKCMISWESNPCSGSRKSELTFY